MHSTQIAIKIERSGVKKTHYSQHFKIKQLSNFYRSQLLNTFNILNSISIYEGKVFRTFEIVISIKFEHYKRQKFREESIDCLCVYFR